MTHLTDHLLLEIVAGRLDPAASTATQAHLTACPACAGRLSALQATWSVLGEWTLAQPAADLIPSIEKAIEMGSRQAIRAIQPRLRWMNVARIAASIVLGVGLGHVAGRYFRTSPSSTPIAAAAPDDVVNLLALDVLAQSGPVGLIDALTDVESSENTGGRS